MRAFVPALAVLAALIPAAGRADPSPSALCRSAIAAAERSLGIPDRLMQAMGVVESGRPDERGGVTAWPWTINVEGAGYVFSSKAEAIAAVNAYRAEGARSIDVGCMQINLMHHPDAFASLEQAFDPAANARYAAEYLQKLLVQTGSWPRAAGTYHSATADLGTDYAKKVLAVWARPGLGEPVPYRQVPPGMTVAGPAASPGAIPPAPAIGGLAMSGSTSARILPLGSPPGTAGVAGRSLDAYRANPTRLATSLFLRRG